MSENLDEKVESVDCPSGCCAGIANSSLVIKDETDISKDLEVKEVTLSSIIEGNLDVCSTGVDRGGCCSNNTKCCKEDSEEV